MDEILESLKNFKFDFNKTDKNVVQRFYVKNHTEETKKLISEMKKGYKQSSEHIEKVRQSRIGKHQTEYQKQRAKESLECAWLLTTPEGKQINIVNLRQFCKENGLDQGNMVKVSQGIIKQNKGWKCIKIGS
jgi:hypothetical protein